MKEITKNDDVVAYRSQKIVNEFKLAKELCDFFDGNNNLNQQMQVIATSAIKLLQDLNIILCKPHSTNGLKEAVTKVYVGERFLKIFDDKVTEKSTLDNIKSIIQNWDLKKTRKAKQCGEVIRLFAGICEAANEDPSNSEKNLVKDLDLAIYYGKEKLIEFDEFCGLRGAYRTTEWGEVAFRKDSRRRDKVEGSIDTNNNTEKEIAEVLGLGNKDKTGITINKLQTGSVVRGIDMLFGLPEGADISGTTADSIWAIETLMNMIKRKKLAEVDPNILLLPVAAIVSGYHHTILECGLSLAINGYNTYAPGFYTSLQNNDMINTLAGKKISKLLTEYEKKTSNRFLVIWEDSSGLNAFQITEPNEKKKFKEFLSLNIKNYKYWKGHLGEANKLNKGVILKCMNGSGLTFN
ncbi:MAG: hypothetical protein D3910_13935 [Candidatus Electrothrix sp. ATG2]|nr:hypothetical protein [Candidatus Electrothrix sp. ATG2]